MTAGLDALWPLFALRIRSERLVLRLPSDKDIVGLYAVAKAGIHLPDEMPFGIAWSTMPSPAFERGFVQHHWRGRADWSTESWQLNLIVEYQGDPIGAQTIGADSFSVLRTVATGSWLAREHQGKRLGREMREAVLGLAFECLGARVATTEAFLDNAASNGVSRSLGYVENGRGSLAPEGIARETQRFRMTQDDWRSRPRSPVTFEGVDDCLAMFGADPTDA